MTATPFHVETDPAGFIEVPAAGTLSRTLHQDDDLRVVVFGFAEGEELSEHTSSRPAVIQVLRGELELTLAGERVTAPRGRLGPHGRPGCATRSGRAPPR